jgi:outer membrane protein, heavy metal efflux system
MKRFVIPAAVAVLLASSGWAQEKQAIPEPSMKNMPGMSSQESPQQPPAATLQEREDPARQTGQNLPAPDLLKDAATRPEIGLADFLDLAGRTNPTLDQANALVRRSQAQARQAGLYPNPTVGYQGDEIRGGEYGGGEQGAFVQQTIVLGGKLGLRRNIYEQQSRADRIGVEEQTYRVRNDVTRAFYAALTAQAAVVIRQRLLAVATDAVLTVHQLSNVGQADAPDILQAEVEAEQAKVDFVAAQRRFIQDFRVLAALAGKPDLPLSPLQGSLETGPSLDAERQVESIVASSPGVKRAEQEAAVAEAGLRDAKREAVPDLELRAGEQYNGEHLLTAPPPKAAGPQSFATAGINIPLWNRNQGNVDAAKADLARAGKEVERTRLEIQRTAEPVAQSYLAAQFAAERYRTELIPRAQRAYQLYLEKYLTMAQAYPQVLISQRTLFELQIGYLSALDDLWSSATALENFTLTGGLAAPISGGSSNTTINLPGASAGGTN